LTAADDSGAGIKSVVAAEKQVCLSPTLEAERIATDHPAFALDGNWSVNGVGRGTDVNPL